MSTFLVLFRVYFVQKEREQCLILVDNFFSKQIEYFKWLFMAKISELEETY